MTIEVFFLVIALYIPSIIATAVSMSKPNTQTNKMFEYYSKLLPNTQENDFKIRKLIHAQKNSSTFTLGNTAQKSRRDTARSDIIRPWINR